MQSAEGRPFCSASAFHNDPSCVCEAGGVRAVIPRSVLSRVRIDPNIFSEDRFICLGLTEPATGKFHNSDIANLAEVRYQPNPWQVAVWTYWNGLLGDDEQPGHYPDIAKRGDDDVWCENGMHPIRVQVGDLWRDICLKEEHFPDSMVSADLYNLPHLGDLDIAQLFAYGPCRADAERNLIICNKNVQVAIPKPDGFQSKVQAPAFPRKGCGTCPDDWKCDVNDTLRCVPPDDIAEDDAAVDDSSSQGSGAGDAGGAGADAGTANGSGNGSGAGLDAGNGTNDNGGGSSAGDSGSDDTGTAGDDTGTGGGLSNRAIAGIAGGGIAALLVIVLIVVLASRGRSK